MAPPSPQSSSPPSPPPSSSATNRPAPRLDLAPATPTAPHRPLRPHRRETELHRRRLHLQRRQRRRERRRLRHRNRRRARRPQAPAQAHHRLPRPLRRGKGQLRRALVHAPSGIPPGEDHRQREPRATGPHGAPGTATFTGFEYSTLPPTFVKAGALTGIKVHNTSDSNSYFSRSDNLPFAQAGIPAHTLCVAYTYPDYHGVGDHWEKIDYPNMARIARMTALGLVMLAENPVPPRYCATISF